MRVAIPSFLELFLVIMALAQSRHSPEPIPEPQIIPAIADPPHPSPPEIAEMLPLHRPSWLPCPPPAISGCTAGS